MRSSALTLLVLAGVPLGASPVTGAEDETTAAGVRIGRAFSTIEAPAIDGRLDEDVWAAAEPLTDFVQADPFEGEPATERTEVRILFDEEAVYIGAMLYDSDPAGLRATFRTGDILLAAGIHPMVVSLPSGEDPDSLIRRDGPSVIRQLLDDAVDLLERKLQILRREGYLDRVEGRRRAVDGLLSTLRAVSDPALRDIYVDRAVEGLGIRRDTLVDEIARLERSRHRRRRPAAGAGRPRRGQSPASRAEHDLLLLLVRDPALTRQAVRVGLMPDHMSDPRGRELFEILSAASDEGVDVPDWTAASAEAGELAKALRESDRELPDAARVFDAVVRRLLYRRHRERIEEIGRAIELAEPEQQRRLLGEKQELVRELRAAGESGAFMPAAEPGRPPKPTTAQR